MSIYSLTIFLVLVAFVLGDNASLPTSNAEESKQGMDNDNSSWIDRWNGWFDWIKFGSILRPTKEEILSKKNDFENLIDVLSYIIKLNETENPYLSIVQLIFQEFMKEKLEDFEDATSAKSIDEQTPSSIPFDGYLGVESNGEIKERNFQCYIIPDLYILAIQEFVPSYKCENGNEMFFVSSKSFVQMQKNVNFYLDDDILRKVNSYTDPNDSSHTRFNFISVVLTLKSDHRNDQVIPNERTFNLSKQRTVDDGNSG